MYHFDAKLLKEIEQTQQLLDELRESLSSPHGGCRCSLERLCAFHAEVAHHLTDACDALHSAAGVLLSRE